MPVLWWRSVGHTHTGYAVEAFVDELLEAAGKDPVEGRLELMSKKPRHAGVLRAVAELADWKNAKLEPGRARGVLAFARVPFFRSSAITATCRAV